MALSNDLISQFAKVATDTKKPVTETTVYGTVVEYEGSNYVRIDGSDRLTPMSTTAHAEPGERVTISIKNHKATVTGNLSSPSARVGKVEDINGKLSISIEELIATKATVDTLDVTYATIESLEAIDAKIENLDVENLDAKYAKIEDLEAVDAKIENLDVENLDAKYAKITDLDSVNADIHNLDATYAQITSAHAEKLAANEATINDLTANKADIADLNASKAEITDLKADVADIDTLIFGSASGSVIQSSFANAVIAQLGTAQIKSAMIESVSADKITAGDIITNNVRVMSEDSSLIISDETMQISDENRVRVQIGKDASNDYSINIWDADGNLMFSKGGITDNAIKEAIIRNDMVSENANISASKLNIDSLFTAINEDGSNTLKSSKILLDDEGQTLDVAFTQMTTDMDDLGSLLESQGTQLSVVQGQIDSKIWQTDITTAIDNIDIGGRNLIIDSKLDKVSDNWYYTPELSMSFDNGYAIFSKEENSGEYGYYQASTKNPILLHCEAEQAYTLSIDVMKLPGMTIPPNSSIVTRHVNPTVRYSVPIPTDLPEDQWTRISGVNVFESAASDGISVRILLGAGAGGLACRNIKLEKGNKATDWSPAPEDAEDKITTLSTNYSNVKQDLNSITATVASHTTEIATKAGSDEVTAVSDKVAAVELDLSGFKATVSETYATQDSVSSLGSRVEQTAEDITSIVSRTDTIEGKFDDYATVDSVESRVTQEAAKIESNVSATYATKGALTSAETLISQNTEAIGLKASKTELDGAVADLEAAIEVSSDSITSYVSDTVGDLETSTDTRITANESMIQQLKNQIASLIIDGDGGSLMGQNEDGTVFYNIGDLEGRLDDVIELLDRVKNASDSNSSDMVSVWEELANLGILKEYVGIGTYKNMENGVTVEEPCVFLGEPDTDFKMVITNTKIMFMDGAYLPTYINTSGLVTENITINNELRQGNFKWKSRPNGNYGLMWKGAGD